MLGWLHIWIHPGVLKMKHIARLFINICFKAQINNLNLGCFKCWTIPYLSKGSIISSWNAATIMSSFAQLIDVMVINNTNKFYQRTWCVIWNIGCLICLQCQISILWEVERLTIVCKIWNYCSNAYNAFYMAPSYGRTTRTTYWSQDLHPYFDVNAKILDKT